MLDYVKFEIISFRCEVQQNVVGVKKLGTDDDDVGMWTLHSNSWKYWMRATKS